MGRGEEVSGGAGMTAEDLRRLERERRRLRCNVNPLRPISLSFPLVSHRTALCTPNALV